MITLKKYLKAPLFLSILGVFSLVFISGCSYNLSHNKDLDSTKRYFTILHFVELYSANLENNCKILQNGEILQFGEFEREVNKLLSCVDSYSYYKKNTKQEYTGNTQQKLKYFIQKDTLYLQIPLFYEGLSSEVQKLLHSFAPLVSSLEIDLQNNGGGKVKEALKTADLFIDKGELATIQTKFYTKTYFAKKETTLWRLPVVLHVNNKTASSAELFAGILLDRERGVLEKPTQTFGKSVIQSLIYLDDTKTEYIMLTTARYILPSKKTLQEVFYPDSP